MRIQAGVLLIIVCLLLSGCPNAEKSTVVRIAHFPNITHGQALVMKARLTLEGEMGEEVDVQWKTFNAGPAVIEAMFAGQIDIAYIGPVPAINAFDKSNGDICIIAGAANGGAELIAAESSGISQISDLDGKTVAVPQLGNTQHLCLLALLKENNLAPVSDGGSVNVIAVSNPDIAGLIDRGELDAALVPEPWASLITINYGAVPIPFEGKDDATSVVIVRKDFLTENPELVEKFLAAHKQITLEIQNNPDQAKIDINAQIELLTGQAISPEVLDAAFSHIIFSDEIPERSLQSYAENCLENGLIQALPNRELTNPEGDNESPID